MKVSQAAQELHNRSQGVLYRAEYHVHVMIPASPDAPVTRT